MQGLSYNVDIVMCIDCTGSMGELLNTVKHKALQFYPDLQRSLEEKDKIINKLRVKVIAFRDFSFDGENALAETDFMELPLENDAFTSFINELSPSGGGHEPESGLEALAIAIQSPWNKTDAKKRQIIILWTDASAHKLEEASNYESDSYPENMPKNFNEITDMWNDDEYIDDFAKRLLIFAPNAYPWSDISVHWENIIFYPSKAGNGLEEVSYSAMLKEISSSV